MLRIHLRQSCLRLTKLQIFMGSLRLGSDWLIGIEIFNFC